MWDAAFLQDITNILTTNGDGQVKVFDVASGEILYRFTGHKNKVNSISLSPGGDSFVSGSEDGAVKIWDLGNFQSDSHLPPGRLQHDILSKCPHSYIDKLMLLVQKKEQLAKIRKKCNLENVKCKFGLVRLYGISIGYCRILQSTYTVIQIY